MQEVKMSGESLNIEQENISKLKELNIERNILSKHRLPPRKAEKLNKQHQESKHDFH